MAPERSRRAGPLAILGVLSSWSAMTADELGIPTPKREAGVLAKFLGTHLDWLAELPASAEFAHEIVTLGRAAKEVVYSTPNPRLELGSCARPDCDRPVFASGGASNGGPSVARCAAGHVWQPHQWLRLAA